MNSTILSAVIALCLVSYSTALYITPNILGPLPHTTSVCFNPAMEPSTQTFYVPQEPYLKCVNDAIVKIISATFQISTPLTCPLQYTAFPEPTVPTCATNIFTNQNVTAILIDLCNGKAECVFSFLQLPNFACVEAGGPPTSILDSLTNIKVTYFCETARARFRPFANKRYNPKFSRNLNHQTRKISYNHMQNL